MRIKLTLSIFLLTIIIKTEATEKNSVSQTGFFTSFDGTKIYYEVEGKGKPVVLVHGFTSTSESWKSKPLYQDLITAGYKVIVLDLRGCGKSDKPHAPEAYEHDAEAKDIIGLIKELRIKKYDLIGYSRGSIIVSRLLLLHKRVSRAVMGGMGDGFTDPEWPRRKMFYEALMGKPIPELEAMVKRIQDSGLDQLALAYLQKSQPSTTPKELAEIKKPVLIICGTEDEDNGSSKQLASFIPKSNYVRVPGNHGSTAQSKEFSEAVISFLRK